MKKFLFYSLYSLSLLGAFVLCNSNTAGVYASNTGNDIPDLFSITGYMDKAQVEYQHKNYQGALNYVDSGITFLDNTKTSDTASLQYISKMRKIFVDFKSLISQSLVSGSTLSNKNNSNIELQQAIAWMYKYSLTSFSDIDSFKPNDYVTREQASKFFTEFAQKALGVQVWQKDLVGCSFSDSNKANTTLKDYIFKSCYLGLMKGGNKKFLPFNKLTRGQAIAILIRAKDGNKSENGKYWYQNYYDLASNYGLLDSLGFSLGNMEKYNLTRGEMAILLYRLNNYVSENATPTEYCQYSYGKLSYNDGSKTPEGKDACLCKTGYTLNKEETQCVKDNPTEICKAGYGEFSYSDGTLATDGGYNCLCKDGYGLNKASNKCIPATESCQELYGKFSYWDLKYMPDGSFSCNCQSGYDWQDDTSEAPCVKK